MIYDINLIPKTKKKTSDESILVTTILILCLFILMGYYGVFVPLQNKYMIDKQIKAKEFELRAYSETLATYNTLLEQTSSLRETDMLLDSIKNDGLVMTELLNNIENSIPDKISFKRLNLTDNLLTVEATAPSYREVAQFIVKLRKFDQVENVIFMNAKSDNENQTHDFTINITLNTTNIINSLQEDLSSIDLEGEVAANETN